MRGIFLLLAFFSCFLILSMSIIPSAQSSMVKEDIEKSSTKFFINNNLKGLRNLIIRIVIYLVDFIFKIALHSISAVGRIFIRINEMLSALDNIVNSRLLSLFLNILKIIVFIFFNYPLSLLLSFVSTSNYFIVMFLYSLLP